MPICKVTRATLCALGVCLTRGRRARIPTDANCQGCDFTGALGLDSAHMADCDLRGARLDWTKLGNHPWFRGAKVTQEQYDSIALPAEQRAALKVGTRHATRVCSH